MRNRVVPAATFSRGHADSPRGASHPPAVRTRQECLSRACARNPNCQRLLTGECCGRMPQQQIWAQRTQKSQSKALALCSTVQWCRAHPPGGVSPMVRNSSFKSSHAAALAEGVRKR